MTTQRGKVVEVDRGTARLRAGQGMVKGLAVIWNHWSKSWTKKLERMDQTEGVFTVEYPEERLDLAEAYRNMPILLYEDETGHELCTACFQCERVCPPQVIHIQQAKHPETGKPIPVAEEFIIEYDACMSCGLCAEVCPFDSIKMDHFYELSTDDHPSLTMRKADLVRPVSYYRSIAPTMWDAVEANANKKLEGSKKRRPGDAGVVPHMIGKAKPDDTAKPPAEQSEKQEDTPAPKKKAGGGSKMSADKQARLAEIRARNAAKKAKDQE